MGRFANATISFQIPEGRDVVDQRKVTSDPYRDWISVYREECVGRIRHMPVNLRLNDKETVVIVDVLPYIGEVLDNA